MSSIWSKFLNSVRIAKRPDTDGQPEIQVESKVDDPLYASDVTEHQGQAEVRITEARWAGVSELDLSQLNLKELPESLQTLKNLTILNCSANRLTRLPEWIGRLKQLRFLVLSNNKISSYDIADLPKLTHLFLSSNALREIPEAILRLRSLQMLDVDFNELTLLPPDLSRLRDLDSFSASGNPLNNVQPVCELSKLQTLFASYCKLTAIPPEIGRLAGLSYLSLRSNQLRSLPASIGQLSKLAVLDLEGNDLQDLPASIRRIPELAQLYLHGNKSLRIPAEVLGPGLLEADEQKAPPAKAADILDYYFRTRGGARPLNEAKMILVGYGGVGKTSLVRRLTHDDFDTREAKTEGIAITDWPVQLNGEDVRLHVWDFGGQEIMHATHQFFLTHRSLYLLVLKGREGHEDADAEYWLSLIRSFAGDSPVIVVLNKIKEHPFSLNRRGLLDRYRNVRTFVETDCSDGSGIDQLRALIRSETDSLPNLRDPFPAAWLAIKNRLAGMRENYISFDQYTQICQGLQESDREGQERLALYLHVLGIALNFKDDPRLRDTHVLNPRWVTNGIYRILNHERLARQKGEIRLADLSEILDLGEYPTERHHFLLELMRKFELCFRFPDAETDRFLIPNLLEKDQPVEAATYSSSDHLAFEYHYPVLPEGLLPRFIVRTYVLGLDRPRWRSGVFLGFEGNTALVIADPLAKTVRIGIKGPPEGRRRLLAIIRSDFEHIHRDYTFEPKAMVPVPGRPEILVPYEQLLVFERNGVSSLPIAAGSNVILAQVKDLLDGVDLDGVRRSPKAMEDIGAAALRVFYSYSHKDEELRDELATQLTLFQRQGLIEAWHDRRITAGTEWKGKIHGSLERADIVLLLVSADFIASDYCYDVEMKRAMERHADGSARVIPIIIRDCKWQSAPFGRLQALPTNGKAVRTWTDRDTAWRNVADGIDGVIKEIGTREKRA